MGRIEHMLVDGGRSSTPFDLRPSPATTAYHKKLRMFQSTVKNAGRGWCEPESPRPVNGGAVVGGPRPPRAVREHRTTNRTTKKLRAFQSELLAQNAFSGNPDERTLGAGCRLIGAEGTLGARPFCP